MDEQTIGKHLVLKYYLDGWFPILGRWSGRLLFVDGFAGPGTYTDGEPGSPVIALECVSEHKKQGRLTNCDIVFLFMESDRSRSQHLQHLLDARRMPARTKCHVLPGSFDSHMSALLDYVDEQGASLAPAFVMIDPFGVKGSPMKLIERILQNPKSECMVSFMYEPIRRFHAQPKFELSLNELFGGSDWRECIDMEDGERKTFLHGLFKAKLKEHGAGQVVFFELWRGSRHIYTIYFASGNAKGCNLMKRAIWKADPSGQYRLRGYAGSQQLLFERTTEPLARQLRERFGLEAIPFEMVEQFVMSDETMFHVGQLRRLTLRPLEQSGKIEVVRPEGGTGFPNGKGITVRFL